MLKIWIVQYIMIARNYGGGILLLSFCKEIESGSQKEKYHKLVTQIAKWYTESVENYAAILKTEMGINTMYKSIRDMVEMPISDDLTYNFGAKLSYFNISDTLIKLILSKFSAGPSKFFFDQHGIMYKEFYPRGVSWLKFDANEVNMTEFLARVFRNEGYNIPFDLQALMINRQDRGGMTHASQVAPCLSAIRCYRNIRRMLVFLDPDLESSLPVFSTYGSFDYDEFLAEPCAFGFNDCTTVLVASSFHDVPQDQLTLMANLPWDLVVDLDGYSDRGGLLSHVNHNCIQRDVLSLPVAIGAQALRSGTTLWYRCGEYQSNDFVPSDVFSIPEYIYFHNGAAQRDVKRIKRTEKNDNIEKIFRCLLKKAESLERMINIVFLGDDSNLVKWLVRQSNRELDDFFITWVGVSPYDDASVLREWFDDDDDQMHEHFRRFNCPAELFFEAFSEHSTSWQPRVQIRTQFSLPGNNRRVFLSENERNNLAPYFDVLYDGCEHVDGGRAEEQKKQFYYGNRASWNTIASDYAICLKKDAEFDRAKHMIRTLLGATQQDPQKRLFFVKHTAGMGGTTLARQLAWALHDEYAVLDVRNYESGVFVRLIENLYDNVLGKAPIIILADDTLLAAENLCNDICTIERRCILILSCRAGNGLLSHFSNANYFQLNSLPDQAVTKLCSRFRSVSKLSEVMLAEKDAMFNREVVGDMRTPFIIGLYYIEEDFNIDVYVKKALDGCAERRYADILAYIAMCDRYNSKNIPVAFVNSILGLRARRDNFLYIVPAASSMIIRDRNAADVDIFHLTHSLLGKHYLDQYCEKYFGGSEYLRNAIYYLAEQMIQRTAAIVSESLREICVEILINILIQNKDTQGRGFSDQNLSVLMMDIGMPESQRNLMKLLAETFRPMADAIVAQHRIEGTQVIASTERQILRLVSHAYAHLGKMYSKGEGNFKKANDMHMLAIKYMPDDDPNVYHMAGSSLLEKLKSEWNNWDDTPITAEQFAAFDIEVRKTQELFDSCCDFGSPEYGLPKILELYYHYLRYIYKVKKINSIADVSLLTETQHQLQIKFLEVLEEAKSYSDFDETAKGIISEYEGKFNTQVMFGEHGKAIEYYQNQVDKYKSSGNVVELEHSLKGLVFARINAARASGEGAYYLNVKDPRQLLEDISQLLNQPHDPKRYSDYTMRSRLFHYWMQFAKITNCSIDSGLRMAKQWLELEDLNRGTKNPEPYYYYKVLQYLNAFSGSGQAMGEVHAVAEKITQLSSNHKFDPRRGGRTKLRDLFVVGSSTNSMDQLLDVTHCRGDEEILKEVARRAMKPQDFAGHLHNVVYQNGVLKLYQPFQWNGEFVWFDIGKKSENSLSMQQLTHKIHIFAGFAVDRLVGISDTARDRTSGEALFMVDSAPKHPTPNVTEKNPSEQRGKTKIPLEKMLHRQLLFIPNRVDTAYNAKDVYLVGTVEGYSAGISGNKDVAKFGDKVISKYGGIETVLGKLAALNSFTCEITGGNENRLYASIYATGQTLDAIIGPPHIKCKADEPKNMTKGETVIHQSNIKNGQTVSLFIDTLTETSCAGHFSMDGKTYLAKISKIPKGKMREKIEKAQKRNQAVSARVVGATQDEVFSVQII